MKGASMSMRRPATYGATAVVPDPGTLAGARTVGGDGDSGMVSPSNPLAHDPDVGRMDDLGAHQVLTDPATGDGFAQYPGIVTRVMLGGPRTAPVRDGMLPAPPYDGGHVELRNRRSVIVLPPDELMLPAQDAGLPSLRVAPESDPLGRISALLAKKVGPLPMGVWAIVVGGGLFMAYRTKAAPEAVAPAGDPLPTSDGAVGSFDGAPVVMSPIVRVKLPAPVVINNPAPAPAPIIVNVPAPPAIHLPVPKAAPKPVAKPKAAPKPVAKPKPAPPRTHTVRSGDTLSGISGAKWPALYAKNRSVIEAAAKRHGKSNSGGGHWIYPGTVLVLP